MIIILLIINDNNNINNIININNVCVIMCNMYVYVYNVYY